MKVTDQTQIGGNNVGRGGKKRASERQADRWFLPVEGKYAEARGKRDPMGLQNPLRSDEKVKRLSALETWSSRGIGLRWWRGFTNSQVGG